MCGRFRSSNAHAERNLSSDEMETLRRSRTPTVTATANGEVQTNKEAQVYVHDLAFFVTVQLLENTPAGLFAISSVPLPLSFRCSGCSR